MTASNKKVPELPGADKFSAATNTWYLTWARSPQASTFTSTEWLRLHMLAPLVEAYYTSPDKNLMAEIRLNESKLGATLEDRLRMRLKIEEPQPDGKPKDAPPVRKDPRTNG